MQRADPCAAFGIRCQQVFDVDRGRRPGFPRSMTARAAAAVASALLFAGSAVAPAAATQRQPWPKHPPPPPGTCQWCGHCCGAAEQVVPPWPPTYAMSQSTVLMPCNGTGLIDPTSQAAGDFSKWAFASIDWSNGKDGPTGWSKGKPMDAEDGMVQQAALLTAANPNQKVGVYRNIIAAQPWFPSVAEKLRDPQYSGWFLSFKDDHSPTVAPRCSSPDPQKSLSTGVPASGGDPQKKLCSTLFHGTQQVPRWPPADSANDGNCSAPGCDCGGVPCGRYLWDHTNSSMREWLITSHILGDTGIGNPNISAIYLDDNWQEFAGPGKYVLQTPQNDAT